MTCAIVRGGDIGRNVSSRLVTHSILTLAAGLSTRRLLSRLPNVRSYDTVAFDDLVSRIVSYWNGPQNGHQRTLGVAGVRR